MFQALNTREEEQLICRPVRPGSPTRTGNWNGLRDAHTRTGFVSEKFGFGNVTPTSVQPFSFSVRDEIRNFPSSFKGYCFTSELLWQKKKGKKEEENTRTRGQVGQAWRN